MMVSVCVLEETGTTWGDKKDFNTLLTPAIQLLSFHSYEKGSGNKSQNWNAGLQIMEKLLYNRRIKQWKDRL